MTISLRLRQEFTPRTIQPATRVLTFGLADCTRITARYYPSCTDAQLVLSDAAHHTEAESDALAKHISADGIAQVYRLLRPLRKGPNDSSALAQALARRLLEQNPNAPLVCGALSRREGLDLVFPDGYFGAAGAPPEPTYFTARDGVRLALRYYPADSKRVVILLHGATTHDKPYAPLARFISTRNLAQVYAPTLRGHGASGGQRGDVDYIGQLEDDIGDLIAHVRAQTPAARIFVLGHSMGGGLGLRFASGRYAAHVDGYILLAPYLGLLAPTRRRGATHGWAESRLRAGIFLTLANAVSISRWNHRLLVKFKIPPVIRSAYDTPGYSYRAWTSAAPHLDFRRDLRALKPTLLLIGTGDQMFAPAAFERLRAYSSALTLGSVPEGTHLGIVYSSQAHQHIQAWLSNPPRPE